MHKPPDLVLFDLDGTISDPLVGIGRSINHALSHFGHAPLELSQLAVHIGPPLDEAFKTITGVQCRRVGTCAHRLARRGSLVGTSAHPTRSATTGTALTPNSVMPSSARLSTTRSAVGWALVPTAWRDACPIRRQENACELLGQVRFMFDNGHRGI